MPSANGAGHEGLRSASPGSAGRGGDDTARLCEQVSRDPGCPLWQRDARSDGAVSPLSFQDATAGLSLGRRIHSPGCGIADGDAGWILGGTAHRGGPRFDAPVDSNGYLWWYFDGVSDDGRCTITVIAFVGMVFSAAYYRARQRGATCPLLHCGFNVVVHGPRHSAWALTEYGSEQVHRDAHTLVFGDNRIERDEHGFAITVAEHTTPWGRPLRGRIRLLPRAWSPHRFALDDTGRHQWWPCVPRGRMEVELETPGLSFEGAGYHDSNGGTEPLERRLERWTWSRVSGPDTTTLLYDVLARDGRLRTLSLRCEDGGTVTDGVEASAEIALGGSRWGLSRAIRVPQGGHAILDRTLVDAPFYVRSVLRADIGQGPAWGVHETVDLQRFIRPSTQWMLPFRTRGVGWW